MVSTRQVWNEMTGMSQPSGRAVDSAGKESREQNPCTRFPTHKQTVHLILEQVRATHSFEARSLRKARVAPSVCF